MPLRDCQAMHFDVVYFQRIMNISELLSSWPQMFMSKILFRIYLSVPASISLQLIHQSPIKPPLIIINEFMILMNARLDAHLSSI